MLADRTHLAWLEEHAALICGELNVKKVMFSERADQYITYTILPDLKRLGPRLGKRLPAVKKLLAEADGGALLAELKARGKVTLALSDGPVALDADDIQVRLQAKEGWAAAEGKACVIVLATELTEDLVREGLAREIARAVNDRRKEISCQFTDRVEIAIVTDSTELRGHRAVPRLHHGRDTGRIDHFRANPRRRAGRGRNRRLPGRALRESRAEPLRKPDEVDHEILEIHEKLFSHG